VTQLIGAICENGEKIVVLSDRMVTTSDGSLAFEHDNPKGENISSHAIALTAGTIHEPELIQDVRNNIGTGNPSIRNLVDKLAEKFREFRKKRIEDEILRAIGIESIDEYHSKQRILHDSLIFDLDKKIRDYKLEVAILLAGVDDEAHLFMLGDPGTWRSYDSLGFCCLGSGDRHAEPIFAFYRFTTSLRASEALYIAFEAKKRSEMAGGIGNTTDVWIIDKNDGIKKIKDETIEELENIYAERETLSKRERFDKRITELGIGTNEVEHPKT